jgi:hypothetical protein
MNNSLPKIVSKKGKREVLLLTKVEREKILPSVDLQCIRNIPSLSGNFYGNEKMSRIEI